MADKRMFSLKIVDSDLFLDMPLSSQCLYFHLSMRADDDDLKILITKGFVIVFERGIIVITHWKRKDRYKPTMYIEQKQQLYQTENGAYISEENVGCHLVNQRLSSGQPSIDKGRLDKVSIDKGRIEQVAPISLYGEYKNIRLTNEEYKKLQDKLQAHTDIMIEKLSRYIKSKGTDYQDHYVTILNWYEQDKEKLIQKNIQSGSNRRYSINYEDSDSL